jgi:hypothetical protein
VQRFEKAYVEAVSCMLYPEAYPLLNRIRSGSITIAIFSEETLSDRKKEDGEDDDNLVEMSMSTLQDLNIIVS